MTHALFRYIINNPSNGLWLGKKNKWVKQEEALHFISENKVRNKAYNLKIDCQIWRVPYQRGLPKQYQIVKNVDNYLTSLNAYLQPMIMTNPYPSLTTTIY